MHFPFFLSKNRLKFKKVTRKNEIHKTTHLQWRPGCRWWRWGGRPGPGATSFGWVGDCPRACNARSRSPTCRRRTERSHCCFPTPGQQWRCSPPKRPPRQPLIIPFRNVLRYSKSQLRWGKIFYVKIFFFLNNERMFLFTWFLSTNDNSTSLRKFQLRGKFNWVEFSSGICIRTHSMQLHAETWLPVFVSHVYISRPCRYLKKETDIEESHVRLCSLACCGIDCYGVSTWKTNSTTQFPEP